MLFEKLDKAGIVFVAYLFHDILDGQAGLCQHLFGQGDAFLDQQLAESQAGLFFDQDGQVIGGEVKMFCHICQADFPHVVCLNHFQDLVKLGGGKGGGGIRLAEGGAERRNQQFQGALFITFSRTVIVTVLSTIITTMFAYGFSRDYLKGKRFYLILGFLSMYISGGIIASFLVISLFGMYNTYWVYIIPWLFGGFYNVIIYNSNFKAIPGELYESARLDGASEFKIYSRVVMPLSKPVIAALAVFTVVGVWNDYQTTLFYTESGGLKTLQYYIVQLVHNANALEALKTSSAAGNAEIYALLQDAAGPTSSKTIELAAIMVASVPMIAMYPFAQKFFTQGMMVGSVKG